MILLGKKNSAINFFKGYLLTPISKVAGEEVKSLEDGSKNTSASYFSQIFFGITLY